MTGSIEYRIAFVFPSFRKTFAVATGKQYLLPSFHIQDGERPAQPLTRAIRDSWKVQAIVLDIVRTDRPDSPCAILELRAIPDSIYLARLTPVDLDAIEADQLGPTERSVIQSLIERTDSDRGPFSRIGWIDEAIAWVEEVTSALGTKLTGELTQFSSGGDSCLVRFRASSRCAYWLKATGRLPSNEFRLTTYLSRVATASVPEVLAFREDWRAWLIEEHGAPLSKSSPSEQFRVAVVTLAQLQQVFINRCDELLEIDVVDQRAETLRSNLDPLMKYLIEVSTMQEPTRPALSVARLNEWEQALEQACLSQRDTGTPDSLMHGDLNLGNILYDGTRCLFIDWSEAYVGSPFISLEQICVHITGRGVLSDNSQVRVLKEEYKSRWRKLLPESRIERGLTLGSLLSVLSALYGDGRWLESCDRYEPWRVKTAGYMMRRIERLLEDPRVLEALCI